MSNSPNAAELRLIKQVIQVLDTKEYDQREQSYYYPGETGKAFQKCAVRAAKLVAEQGVDNTCATLLNIARRVQALSKIEWEHTASLARAFERGVKESPAIEKIEKKGNPFKGVDLGHGMDKRRS